VLTGEDQLSLRSQGQLSDVACMIPAATFQAYRYQGKYAEDLLLGVRMIRDGHRLGFLSSVQVIHSHNRPVAYHLKRTFVDVLFLMETFADYTFPFTDTLSGAVAAGAALEPLVRDWRPTVGADAAQSLRGLARSVRRAPLAGATIPPDLDFGLPALGPWIDAAIRAEDRPGAPEASALRSMLASRLDELAEYAGRICCDADARLAQEIGDAVRKVFAAVVGAQFCFLYLTHAYTAPEPLRRQMQALRDLMLKGV